MYLDKYSYFCNIFLKIIKVKDKETEDALEDTSRHSSTFNTVYNDILELASNVLTDASKRIQEKIEEMEKLKSDLEVNKTIHLSNLNNNE